MIEQLLYFVLGFLCAAFLVALVAPAVWRRTVTLTRRRIEATTPLTRQELTAEKDGLRASHAVEMRRLDMDLQATKGQSATQKVQLADNKKHLKSLTTQRDTLKEALAKVETEAKNLHEEARQREERLHALTTTLRQSEDMLETQRGEFSTLARQYEETSFASSARQIDLVARESDIERLKVDMSTMKGQLKSSEKLARENEREASRARIAVAAETRRADELDKKMQRLITRMSDREDKLERRENELRRLREQLRLRYAEGNGGEGALQMVQLQTDNMRLEGELAELEQRFASLRKEKGRSGKGRSLPELEMADEDLQQRLAVITSENERLKAELTAGVNGNGGAGDTKLLRDQISVLAAEMVNLTASLEGPNSPINRVLENAGQTGRQGTAGPSLADRIRSLREAARP